MSCRTYRSCVLVDTRCVVLFRPDDRTYESYKFAGSSVSLAILRSFVAKEVIKDSRNAGRPNTPSIGCS